MEYKSERKTSLLSGLTILAVLIVLIDSVNCKKTPVNPQVEQAKAEEQRIKRAVGELAQAQNAVVNWRQVFAAKGPRGRIYSAELAPVLIRPDGRSLLFIADVVDVSPSANAYVCSFQADVNLSWKLRLVLGCTPDQATQIMHASSGKFAVVAQIFSLGSAELNAGGDGLETEGGRFSASGKCVGQLFVGKDYFDDFLDILSFPSPDDGRQ
jgi:heme exporter protein D